MTADFQIALPDAYWSKRAACRNLPPWGKELFFPLAGEDGHEAKAICAGCDVKRECLDWALTRTEEYGIWGGLTAPQRRRMRRAGADVRFAQCRYCKQMFSFVWDSRASYKTPNFCNDVCKTEDRREKRNEWRRQKKLGNPANGVVQ